MHFHPTYFTQTHIRLHLIAHLNSSTVPATEELRLVAMSTEFKPSLRIFFLVKNNDSLYVAVAALALIETAQWMCNSLELSAQ